VSELKAKLQQLGAEQGFGLIELLIAMVVLQIALLALIGAFGSGAVALGRAAHINTATALVDQQMELYRAMPYEAIGLDAASAPTSGMYVADTVACPTGQSPVCGNTLPRDNSGNTPWSCTAASGTTSVSTYFSANGINPCLAHRPVTGAASPDRRTYYVDTYISFGAASGQRPVKRITVIVRDGTTTTQLAKEVSTFDCSTGNAAGAAPC
jgi:type II secretory pathway pseudopilin PulG